MTAQELAENLGAAFLEEGIYEGAGGASGAQFVTHAADGFDWKDYFDADEPTAGMHVQSVGFEKGKEEPSVIVYVTRGSQKALRSLPTEVEGIPVKAFVMGKPKVSPAGTPGPSNLYERNGRIACGSSFGPGRDTTTGTLGAILTNGTHYFALSNNHVIGGCNHTIVGMPVMSPAPYDSRAGRRTPTEVGLFHDLIELRSGFFGLVPPMTMDAAIAEVTDPARLSSWQGNQDEGYDTPRRVVVPHAGMRVKKFGRTTGFTTGTVEALAVTPWRIDYKARKFNTEVWFQNTWTVKSDDADPFSAGGDSGSLIVTEDGQSAVGLHFAGNPAAQRSIFCELGPILSHFGNLRLLSAHGV